MAATQPGHVIAAGRSRPSLARALVFVAGEDMILRPFLGSDRTRGSHVDVGAFHPTVSSNTYFFYLNGWSGIKLESNDWTRFRPRFVVVEDEQVHAGDSRIIQMMKRHGYEMCGQNVIILDKIHECYLIDRSIC